MDNSKAVKTRKLMKQLGNQESQNMADVKMKKAQDSIDESMDFVEEEEQPKQDSYSKSALEWVKSQFGEEHNMRSGIKRAAQKAAPKK
jgi:hypothetical protein